jgi:hypothetical protein
MTEKRDENDKTAKIDFCLVCWLFGHKMKEWLIQKIEHTEMGILKSGPVTELKACRRCGKPNPNYNEN